MIDILFLILVTCIKQIQILLDTVVNILLDIVGADPQGFDTSSSSGNSSSNESGNSSGNESGNSSGNESGNSSGNESGNESGDNTNPDLQLLHQILSNFALEPRLADLFRKLISGLSFSQSFPPVELIENSFYVHAATLNAPISDLLLSLVMETGSQYIFNILMEYSARSIGYTALCDGFVRLEEVNSYIDSVCPRLFDELMKSYGHYIKLR